MRKAPFAWSGGKDSALALYNFRKAADKEFEIAALLTTITESYARISMHGVRQVLLQRQASPFVYDGPIFRWKVSSRKGEVVLRDERFYYCDLLPA